MDSLPRKRKLVDCGGNNIAVPKKQIYGVETLNQEENELNACNQYRGLSVGDDVNAEQVPKEVLPKKPLKKVFGGVVKKEEIDSRQPTENKLRKRNVHVHEGDCDDDADGNNDDDDDDDDGDDDDNDDEGDGDDDEDEDEDEDGRGSQISNSSEHATTTNRTEIVWFSTDYIEDIISHEMKKETAYRLSENFCRKFEINPTGREILIDWLISVQVHLKAENCTLHLAVALLDIVLDSVHIPINELQGAAVAAFWVAYKYIHGSLSMKTLLNLCAGSVTRPMIEANEILVLQTSRLIRAGGSLTVFFNYFLYKIFGFKFPPEIYYCGLYFIEIMLLQFVFVDCPAYEKAVTAVFTALVVFGCSDRFAHVDVTNFISKRKLVHVYRRLMRSLRFMYNDRDALKNSNVYRKYKSSRYFRISVHQCLKCLATA